MESLANKKITDQGRRGDNMDSQRLEEKSNQHIDEDIANSRIFSRLLYIVGTIIFASGLISMMLLDMKFWNLLVYGLIVAAFGEIISLLQRIYVNTKK